MPRRGIRLSACIVLLTGGWVSAAQAEDASRPPLTYGVRNTTDIWTVADGGVRRGTVVLNKLQASATADGAAIGLSGWRAHAQMFRTDGKSLSDRIGDIQTATNIEAIHTFRLFEAWVERDFGDDQSGGSVRAGLIDYNGEFDAIEPAGLFINSSHGIGPDVSKSGRNGPSIFPVSSMGIRAELRSGNWTLRAAAFDGVPGDPDAPRAFAAVKLRKSDGAFIAVEANYKVSEAATVAIGGWHYTARLARVDDPGVSIRGKGGAYAYGSVSLAEKWAVWLRLGLADARVQQVAGYVGTGVVATGLIAGRPEDRVGLAIAHAVIGPAARQSESLPGAETAIEATYLARISQRFAIQPDVQYVIHPAGVSGVASALAFGLRLILALDDQKSAASDDAMNPSTPPDAPDAG